VEEAAEPATVTPPPDRYFRIHFGSRKHHRVVITARLAARPAPLMTKRGSHARRKPRVGDGYDRRHLTRVAVSLDSYLRLVLALPPQDLRCGFPVRLCECIALLRSVVAQESAFSDKSGGHAGDVCAPPSPCSSCTEVADDHWYDGLDYN